MLAAADSDSLSKRDPRDFAHVEGRQARRAAVGHPVGPGPPGLAHRVLGHGGASTSGAAFDIHGGGIDLVFPHHENEIAQSKAAGDGFAQLLAAQRLGHHERREDEQVARQLAARRRGRHARAPRRAALLPRRRPLPLHASSSPRPVARGRPGVPPHRGVPAPRPRGPRPGEPSWSDRRRGRRRSTPPWTTTSPCPQALAVVHEHRARGQRGARRPTTPTALATAFDAVLAHARRPGPQPVGARRGRTGCRGAGRGRPRSSTHSSRSCWPSVRTPGPQGLRRRRRHPRRPRQHRHPGRGHRLTASAGRWTTDDPGSED